MKKSSLVAFIVVIFLTAIFVDCVTPKAQAARSLTPAQMQEMKVRIARKRAVKRHEEAEASRIAKLAKTLSQSPRFRKLVNDKLAEKRKAQIEQAEKARIEQARTDRNRIYLRKGVKNSESIVYYHSKMEAKKAEVKKLLRELAVLQKILNELVVETVRAEPGIDLSGLLSLSDPNYIDDPNVVTIAIVEGTAPTPTRSKPTESKPTFKSAPVETAKPETLFIDLKARN